MSSTMISEAIIMVAVIIAGSMLTQVFFIAITKFQYSSNWATKDLSEKMLTSILIIYATNSSSNRVVFWVKNIGAISLTRQLVKMSDVILISPSCVSEFSYSDSGSGWSFSLLNSEDEKWDYGETIQVTLRLDNSLEPGDYTLIFVVYNGVKTEYTFSIG